MFINNIKNPTLNFQILQYKDIKEIFFFFCKLFYREFGEKAEAEE